MRKIGWFIFGLICTIIFVSALANLWSDDEDKKVHSANVAVIEIVGVITESLPVLEQIDKVRKNKNLKALVVRIDSPGGAVGASQEIYLALKRLRDHRPVVVSMGNMAASGGLYISLGAEKVYALPGSLTGSLGVLMPLTNFSRLIEKMYIDPVIFRSGVLKDAGNPLKPMSPMARKYLQSLVEKTFMQFRKHVQSERKLSDEDIQKLSDGRVVDGLEGKALGLVDELGTFQDALDQAATMGKVKGEVEPVYLSRKPRGLVERWLEGALVSLWNKVSQQDSPYLYYKWDPSSQRMQEP